MNLLDHFPVFEANQVLSSRHLNDGFDYLDQQTRQTRSLLIGIGIACGLEFKLGADGSTALLSKGCGVTSEGYLVVEPEDVSLTSYRSYVLPTDVDYPPLKDPSTQEPYLLWELFPAGEPNTTALDGQPNFLNEKAVLLFLELKKQGLRNCSPNNCDDKGSEITVTLRRLLIARSDLDQIIATTNGLGTGLTSKDIDLALSARLDLPDLRLRRFDVPNTNPATSNDVYAAFLNIFRSTGLAKAMGDALSKAYAAFQPLLVSAYPTNPFTNFGSAFDFLDTAPTNTTQVKFLQYYVDLFDDLVHAYDEFRWKGAALFCACCPSPDLFARHLMLGLVHPETADQPGRYRQEWLASPAVGACAEDMHEVVQLFARLVEMTACFTNAPSLPQANLQAQIDPQIRLTPSTLDERPLASKAIPYYYTQTGSPALYKLWNIQKTRRNRANRNLSYRADEYSPTAPDEATNPLRYDLEPYDFLRVEGHLGKDVQRALSTLLTLKSQYRLPIDIIALRTGAYDDSQPVDLSQNAARFQDLEAIYAALREELLASLAEGVRELYDTLVVRLELAGGAPELTLLKTYAPRYTYPANSVGSWYEKNLKILEGRSYIDIDQNAIDINTVATAYQTLLTGTTGPLAETRPHAMWIYYMSKLSAILPQQLDALAYTDFENKYQDLLGLIHFFRSIAVNEIPEDLKTYIPQAQLINLFEEILFGCKLEAIRAVHDEYLRRLGDLKKRQFLSTFLTAHPGIQHKAGVPLGGTFILVYHDEPQQPATTGTISRPILSVLPQSSVASLSDAIRRISANNVLLLNPDIRIMVGSLVDRLPPVVNLPQVELDATAKMIASAVDGLGDGTVIADFFLPYRVSSDTPGIQYILPPSKPRFSINIGCTDANNVAVVTVEPTGGVNPYDVSIDGASYQALSGPLLLATGVHALRLRDAEGAESVTQSLTIAAPLTIEESPKYLCSEGQFTARAQIRGGVPPYTVEENAKIENRDGVDWLITDPTASGSQIDVQVTDSAGCTAQASFTHTCCALPCDGIALRRGYRFWIPDYDENNVYGNTLEIVARSLSVETSAGESINLTDRISKAFGRTDFPNLSPDSFRALATDWTTQINKVIAAEPKLRDDTGKVPWLTLTYEPTVPGQLGVLWIEYFECLSFNIEIAATVVRRNNGTESFDAFYTPSGTVVAYALSRPAMETKVFIPANGGTRTDRCSNEPTPEKICPKPPAFSLEITTDRATPTFHVTVTPPNILPDLFFLWEASDGSPSMGNGESFTTAFASGNSKPMTVTVTAFTKAGCTVTQSMQWRLG